MYEVRFHNAVKGDLRRMDKTAVKEIKNEHLPLLKENPHLAKPLTGIFKRLYSYHFSYKGVKYRAICTIKENENVLVVVFIGSRENIYDRLRRRIRR